MHHVRARTAEMQQHERSLPGGRPAAAAAVRARRLRRPLRAAHRGESFRLLLRPELTQKGAHKGPIHGGGPEPHPHLHPPALGDWIPTGLPQGRLVSACFPPAQARPGRTLPTWVLAGRAPAGGPFSCRQEGSGEAALVPGGPPDSTAPEWPKMVGYSAVDISRTRFYSSRGIMCVQ